MMIFCKIHNVLIMHIEVLKKKNISFATLGVEECEPCLAHTMLNHEHEREETCKTCKNRKNLVQLQRILLAVKNFSEIC